MTDHFLSGTFPSATAILKSASHLHILHTFEAAALILFKITFISVDKTFPLLI